MVHNIYNSTSFNLYQSSHFPQTLDILAQSYELKGMVRCASHHFTKTINNHTEWICIDDFVSVSQKFHFNSGSV